MPTLRTDKPHTHLHTQAVESSIAQVVQNNPGSRPHHICILVLSTQWNGGCLTPRAGKVRCPWINACTKCIWEEKVHLVDSEASAAGLRIFSFEVGTMTTQTTLGKGEGGGGTIGRHQKRLERQWARVKQAKKKKSSSENSDVEQQMSEYGAHLFGACCVNGYANRQFSPSGRNQHCQVSTMQPNWR